MLWTFDKIFLQLDFFPPKGTFLFSAAHIKKASCTHFRNKVLPYYQLGVSSLFFIFLKWIYNLFNIQTSLKHV